MNISPLSHAARAGIILGLYFALKYLAFMYALEYPLLILLYVGGTLAVPFICYHFTHSYRELVAPAGAPFPFRLAWAHGTLLYILATILLLIPEYFYYDQIVYEQLSHLDSMIEGTPYQDALYKLYGGSPAAVISKALSETSPLMRAFSSLSTATFYGGLLSLINAYLLRRKPFNHQ